MVEIQVFNKLWLELHFFTYSPKYKRQLQNADNKS